MKISKELKIFSGIIAVFLEAYLVPFTNPVIRCSGMEALLMLQEYAQQHVLLYLVPAFFIAGAIAVFISQASVIKYLGVGARKALLTALLLFQVQSLPSARARCSRSLPGSTNAGQG